jgi:hypothetical protein
MRLYTHKGTAGRRRKPFPPHGPHLVYPHTEGFYLVQYLACRLVGPERNDALESKRAFDEATDARAATGAYSPKGVERYFLGSPRSCIKQFRRAREAPYFASCT